MAQMLDARQLPLYLKRVGLSHAHGTRHPSLAGLSQIGWQHMQHIPFENLSLRNAKAAKAFTISTKLEDLVAKLVLGNRGGYCFEVITCLQQFRKPIQLHICLATCLVALSPA